jgi:UDP-glucose 4-epimerase
MSSSEMQDQRVRVTGASGFIGRRLCTRLRLAGAEVHGVSRSPGPISGDGIVWWRAGLADEAAASEVFASVEPELVLHLASQVAGARTLDLVSPTLQANLVAAVNVLSAAQRTGSRRVVLAGSMEQPDLGDSDAVASSPYAVAKWASSAYARMFHALFDTPAVTLRIFMVYGPGQRDLEKLIPYVTLALLKGQQPRVTSGSRPVDWIYVDDVVEAFLSAARAPHVEGSTIDVGSGELVSVRTVVEELMKLTQADVEPLFGALADRPRETVQAADIEASVAALGWRATTSLDQGLAQTVRWARELVGQYTTGSPMPTTPAEST